MKKQTAFITGASSGFGQACARYFAEHGWRVVLCARRQERLFALREELLPLAPVHVFALDVRDRYQVEGALAKVPKEFAAIDVLVNNAGLARGLAPAHRAAMDDWEEMVDTNIKGLLYCTRALLPGMVERGRGHVINIGSVAGSTPYPGGNVYGASKAFVRQFSRNLKADLLGTPVRVTNIEPGAAETEFSLVRFHGDEESAKRVYSGFQPLTAADIAEIVYWTATLPPHVNINALEVMATGQAWGPFMFDRRQ